MSSILRRTLRARASFITALTVTVTATVTAAVTTAVTATTVIALSSLLATPVFAQAVPTTDDEKAFYSIGVSLATQLETVQPISDSELEVLIQGVRDAAGGSTLAVEQQEGANLVRAMVQERQSRAAKIEAGAAADFLAAEAGKKGAKTTESGLIYTELKAGKGAHPSATDKVRVHYHGTLRDGTVFDSSVDRGQPSEFPLNRVIACWTEGVALIKEGGKARLVCPSEIAYGDRATGRIPAGAALTFEVELIEILK
jgi:FKBP-type peptidyl-prolyl cis-trans isomerase FkpA